jgi:hypothetical protein
VILPLIPLILLLLFGIYFFSIMMQSNSRRSCLARTLLMGGLMIGLPLVTLAPANAADVTGVNFGIEQLVHRI